MNTVKETAIYSYRLKYKRFSLTFFYSTVGKIEAVDFVVNNILVNSKQLSAEHTHIYIRSISMVTVNKALGKLTSGLSVVDSEAGAERPEEPSLPERPENMRFI